MTLFTVQIITPQTQVRLNFGIPNSINKMKAIVHSEIQNVIPLKNFKEYMAAERTELALETTQLAWIRTVLTFMVLGLTISKGMEALYNAKVITGKGLIENTNIAGIFLIITGTVMLTATTFYFIIRRRQLAKIRGSFSFKMIPTILTSISTIFVGAGLSYLLIVS